MVNLHSFLQIHDNQVHMHTYKHLVQVLYKLHVGHMAFEDMHLFLHIDRPSFDIHQHIYIDMHQDLVEYMLSEHHKGYLHMGRSLLHNIIIKYQTIRNKMILIMERLDMGDKSIQ